MTISQPEEFDRCLQQFTHGLSDTKRTESILLIADLRRSTALITSYAEIQPIWKHLTPPISYTLFSRTRGYSVGGGVEIQRRLCPSYPRVTADGLQNKQRRLGDWSWRGNERSSYPVNSHIEEDERVRRISCFKQSLLLRHFKATVKKKLVTRLNI